MGTVAAAVLAMTLTATPSNGGLLTPPQITINDGPGQQSEPHVDGNTAAYSNSVTASGVLVEEIRYYDFPTNTDLAISNTLSDGTRATDLLSDVDQGHIVFTRVFPDRTAIMLFDAATQSLSELAPAPNTTRIGVAIGAQTVVFVDYALSGDGNGELMVLNLATNAVTRLTNDSISDSNPAVSPDGNVVTWTRCESANCDIYRATRSGSVWLINPVSTSVLREDSPDTNGTQIVYERYAAGATGTDIVIVPAAGGAETVLELPGEQYNPTIRGQLVAFESRTSAGAIPDLFLVDLATNRVFQITNTPTVTETLNDITLLSTGEVRVVWQSSTGPGDSNIYGATFSLPAVTPPVDPTCANRSVVLEATRFYSPTRSVDGHVDFRPAMSFAIPASLPVVVGNAGNKKATLTLNLSNNRTVECEYRSGSNQSHPNSPAQLALASSYVLSSCELVHQGCGGHGDDDGDDDDDDGHGNCNHGGNHNHNGPNGSCSGGGNGGHGHGRHRHSGPRYLAGTIVNATSADLHIQNGDTTKSITRVRVTLGEVCSTSSVSSPLEAGNSIDGPQEAAGCSSSGASLTPFLFAFAFLALMLRRPASIRLVTRREQRRLPR